MSDEHSGGEFAFVDSNVLIYAHDEGAGVKREAARAVVERLWEERSGRLSVQVLQEFFVNATVRSGRRRLEAPLDVQEAREVVEDFSRWGVHRPGAADVLAAIDIHRRVGVSFWDAMIVQSASSQGCEVLFSEDLNDGQIYEGVRLENPFAPGRLPGGEKDAR